MAFSCIFRSTSSSLVDRFFDKHACKIGFRKMQLTYLFLYKFMVSLIMSLLGKCVLIALADDCCASMHIYVCGISMARINNKNKQSINYLPIKNNIFT